MRSKKSERDVLRWRLTRQRRHFQFGRAILVGWLAGLLAVVFQLSLHKAEFIRISFFQLLNTWSLGSIFIVSICVSVGGLSSWMTQRFAPEASGSGIPHVKGVLLRLRTLKWWKILPVKYLGGVLAIGTGFSLGREGPTVQMGAVAGKIIAQWLRVPRRLHGQLIAAGAGAGLAAAFNAPLAGFIFVIEELRREFSPLTYGTALIAAVLADFVTRFVLGQQPSFHVNVYSTPTLSDYPLFVLLGVACGVIGLLFNRYLLKGVDTVKTRFGKWTWQKGAIAGFAVGTVACVLPSALGGGQATSESIITGSIASVRPDWMSGWSVASFLLVLLCVKLLLTIICYCSGVPGGIFAPMLVLGALTGGEMAVICQRLLGTGIHPDAFTVVGMAAIFAAVVRAPLTGSILILEMTGSYPLLFAFLLASMVAYVTSDVLMNPPIYEALLELDLRRSRIKEESRMLTLTIENGAELSSKRLGDFEIPEGTVIFSIQHGSKIIPINPDVVLLEGMVLTFIIKDNPDQSELKLTSMFNG